jgi:surface polysaccharide O-acyltransferase-like enzyme
MSEKQSTQFYWANSLRVLATISVIFLHVAANYLVGEYKITSLVWIIADIYDSSVRFAVPVFIMLTGALLLHKDYSLREFFTKRLTRVFIPFVFWSLIYIAYNVYYTKFTQPEDLIFYIYSQLRDGSCFHLWYVYMILGLYLIIPVLRLWIKNGTEKDIRYFLVVWIVVLLLFQPLLRKFRPNVDFTYFSGYIGYLVLGYYLSIIKFKNIRIISLLFIAIGVSITMLGTYYLSKSSGSLQEYFYGYLTPNVLIASTGVFLLFKSIQQPKANLFTKAIQFIDRYCYGIYLVHIFVIMILNKFGITPDFINPILGIPVFTFICFFISFGLIFLVNKLYLGKYVSG